MPPIKREAPGGDGTGNSRRCPVRAGVNRPSVVITAGKAFAGDIQQNRGNTAAVFTHAQSTNRRRARIQRRLRRGQAEGKGHRNQQRNGVDRAQGPANRQRCADGAWPPRVRR